jgi:GNAT superfamily N-acetyltransferase
MADRFRSTRFDPTLHDLAGFTCGEEPLDRWLKEQAVASEKRGTARTWVWTDTSDESRVLGYYALAAHKVARDEVPKRLGRGGPVEIPAILLARLALAKEIRGQGLGAVLLADALHRVVDVAQVVGARLVVVDALHENVATFYEGPGFARVPGSLVLTQRISDIAAALRSGRLGRSDGRATQMGGTPLVFTIPSPASR